MSKSRIQIEKDKIIAAKTAEYMNIMTSTILAGSPSILSEFMMNGGGVTQPSDWSVIKPKITAADLAAALEEQMAKIVIKAPEVKLEKKEVVSSYKDHLMIYALDICRVINEENIEIACSSLTPRSVSYMKQQEDGSEAWRKKVLPPETVYFLKSASAGKSEKINLRFDYNASGVDEYGTCELSLKEAEDHLTNFKEQLMMALMLTEPLSMALAGIKLGFTPVRAKKEVVKRPISDHPLFGSW